jgi:hypothetical protein
LWVSENHFFKEHEMSTTDLIITLALTGYAVYQQTRQHEVVAKSRFKLALIYGIVGIVLGVQAGHTAAAAGLLAISLLASLAVGFVRGRRTRMWTDDQGRVFSQGTAFTVNLFLALVAFKFAVGTVAYFGHVAYAGSLGEVLLMIALMVGVQAEIIHRRALRLTGPTSESGPALVAAQ